MAGGAARVGVAADARRRPRRIALGRAGPRRQTGERAGRLVLPVAGQAGLGHIGIARAATRVVGLAIAAARRGVTGDGTGLLQRPLAVAAALPELVAVATLVGERD